MAWRTFQRSGSIVDPRRKKIADLDKTKDTVTHYTGIGLAIGLCFGSALGAAFGDAGTGLGLGLALGLVSGAAIGRRVKKKQETPLGPLE